MDLHNGLDIEVYDLHPIIYTSTTTTTTSWEVVPKTNDPNRLFA